MKNLTLRVREETLERARLVARERSTSVNALVRGYLEDLARQDSKREQARKEILALCEASDAQAGPRTWTREGLYDR